MAGGRALVEKYIKGAYAKRMEKGCGESLSLPFYLKDDTGVIRIIPDGAIFRD
jgi:hypothetical protein